LTDFDDSSSLVVRPDGVQRGLVAEIIARFARKGFTLRAMKMMNVSKEHAEKHYADLSSKPFFGGLVSYMCSGPVVAMVWEGKDVVKTGRKIIGATNPAASEPGTIRGDFCIEVGRNVIHGSDAVESAQHEIGLWFPEGVCEYEPCAKAWIYE
jgi:nucleoside-diphosphate kinase